MTPLFIGFFLTIVFAIAITFSGIVYYPSKISKSKCCVNEPILFGLNVTIKSYYPLGLSSAF